MRYRPINPQVFIDNRANLSRLMLPNSLAIVNANDILPTNADGTLPFRQSSDLFYLSGIDQEETILLLCPQAHEENMREILFLRETNELLATWEGHKLTKEEAAKMSGIKRVEWLSQFRSLLHRLMCESEHIYLNTNEHKRAVIEVETREARFVKETQARYPLHDFQRLARLLHRLRAVKSDIEIDLLREACAITKAGFLRACHFVKPGVQETEIEAEFAHEFIRRGGNFAYTPIIASGKNTCVLHYTQNDQTCRPGDLLLLDVAASYANYNADLTRTIPVSGKFSRRQRQVYNAVLRVLRATSRAAIPGKLPKQWQKDAEAVMQTELLELGLLKPSEVRRQDPDKPALKKYFMHGVGHPLGLDVHDVGLTTEPIQSGWVMTVEPGIYLPEEGFAVRLENDIVVQEGGNIDLMADIPIEADEIERLMSRAPKRKTRRSARLTTRAR
ncbi:MAG TPA: Xaa-Pro aminopeptidase [Candidatus Limnocylindrales bacterium]|jgi:Xaa-Pro aminopeptidase|nr:Xaa-Pro aminopeptidase [Candidatus Limnocylindrales bacterium]